MSGPKLRRRSKDANMKFKADVKRVQNAHTGIQGKSANILVRWDLAPITIPAKIDTRKVYVTSGKKEGIVSVEIFVDSGTHLRRDIF